METEAPRAVKAGVLCLLLPALLIAACGPVFAEAQEPAPFWDTYLSYRSLARTRPDSAAVLAEQLLHQDEDHFLGSWLRAAALDSLDRVAELAETGSATRPGRLVTAGTIRFLRGEIAEARAAFAQAHEAYQADGRSRDACYALLWRAELVLRERGKPDRTTEGDIVETERSARDLGDPVVLADVLLLKSEVESVKDAETAIPILEEVLELLTPRGPGRQLAMAHFRLAVALKRTGDFNGAETHYRAVLDLAHQMDSPLMESRAIAGLGHIQLARGANREALALYRQALALVERIDAKQDIQDRHADIGFLYNLLGRSGEARRHLEEAVRLCEQVDAHPADTAQILDRLACIEASTGQYESARKHWEEAIRNCGEYGFRNRLPFPLLHLAQLHLDLGDAARAKELATEGLTVARETGHHRAQLPLLLLLSNASRAIGDYEEALRVAREASALAREQEPRFLWSISRSEAAALHELGRTREAIVCLDSTIALFPQIPDSLKLTLVLRQQGNIHLQNGGPEVAVPLFREALAISRILQAPYAEAGAKLDLGRGMLAIGRPQEALPLLESGLAWIEQARAGIASSQERGGYMGQWYDDCVALARAYVRTGHQEEAFATLERTRAREMQQLFGTRTPGLRGRVSRELAEALERTESDLTEAQACLLQEYAKTSDERLAELPTFEERVDSLKGAWDDLSKRLEREAPAYGRDAGLLAPAGTAEILDALTPGERLLAFMVGSEGFLLFDFHDRRLRVHEVSWPESDLTAATEKLAESIRQGNPGAWREVAAVLADSLLGRCRLDESPPQVLYVLPDGALHNLAFEVLLLPAADGEERIPLVEHAAVIYADAASLLLDELHPLPRTDVTKPACHLVAFGDPRIDPTGIFASGDRGEKGTLGPLPYARREVRSLAGLFPDARVFLGDEATEERFFLEAPKAEIVHIAAHAFVDDRHPRFSGIVLAPSQAGADAPVDEDGFVQAFEVAEENLDLDLAVLSACESGSGRLLRGEGLIGLSRAFRLAGTRNLIVSLWKVDDAATADFMAEFYASLTQGESAATALRQAKLAFLHGERMAGAPIDSTGEGLARGVGRRVRGGAYTEPAAWAPFVLIGTKSRQPRGRGRPRLIGPRHRAPRDSGSSSGAASRDDPSPPRTLRSHPRSGKPTALRVP